MKDSSSIRRENLSRYRGLSKLLYIVRWGQHLLSIIAEVLILLSFAMSGMDVSLGGVMAKDPLLKVLWAAMFALGIDTAFALSWVRVRRHLWYRQWLACIGNGLLALGMSFVVFEPISIQLMQQSLNLSFGQAVANLGINMALLTYARAGVAVFLGAILAVTNTADEAVSVGTMAQPKRRSVWPKKLLYWLGAFFLEPPSPPVTAAREPMVLQAPPPTEPPIYERITEPMPVGTVPVQKVEVPLQPPDMIEQVPDEQVPPLYQSVETPEQPLEDSEQPTEAAAQPMEEPAHPIEETAQPEQPSYDTPEKRAAKVSELDLTGLSAPERVARVLELFPDISDRELGKLSGMSAATAKKHRETFKPALSSMLPAQVQVVKEDTGE